MKRILFLLALFASLQAVCQNKTLNLVPGTDGAYTSFFGTAADTIVDTDTKDYVFLLNSPWTFDAAYQIISTNVSGYTKFKVVVTESMDGSNYYAITGLDADTCASGQVSSLIFTGHKNAVISAKYLKFSVTGIDSTQNETIKGYLKLSRKYTLP